MAISGSPPIKFSQIQTEWTGTANFLAYVKGGTYVKTTDTNVGSVNTAAPLKILQFLGAAKVNGPSFVSAGTWSNTPGQPSGVATNDILVMLAVGNPTTPANWTLKGTGTRVRVYWQRYAGLGSPTLTAGCAGQISAFRGCITSGDPFNAFGTFSDGEGVDTAQATPASITTSVNNCLILALIGLQENDTYDGTPVNGGGISSINGVPTTYTTTSGGYYGGNIGRGISIYRGTLATAGATGGSTINTSVTTDNYSYISAVLGALRPP